ncbi:MAG TPA: SpoIIE family protein phosphatase, partial [Verrucomicrobiae bacterium]|nr:SpoIIE family protein phosphatase [Verrucomicrobiae bacterium]
MVEGSHTHGWPNPESEAPACASPAENVLRERAEFLETVADRLPIGFAVVAREDEKIRFTNAKMQEIVGWSGESLTYLPELMEKLIPDPEQRNRIKALVEEDVGSGDPKRMHWEFTVTRKSGENAVIVAHVIPTPEHDITIFTVQDITEHRLTEHALRRSEMWRTQLETEIFCAAEVQKHLLPADPPRLRRFELAALCLPARQVGGDFYDWHEMAPGILTFAIGDVMGKGLPAAILMATIRATLRAVTRSASPLTAVRRAREPLQHDLDAAESFVTMFLGQLNDHECRLTYVDCGHGFGFMLRRDGTVEELLPRGLPLGVAQEERYREGTCIFQPGDAVVLYSDGLIDADPPLVLDRREIAARLAGARSAREMVDRTAAFVPSGIPLP